MRKDEYEKLHGSLDGWNASKFHNKILKKDDFIKLYGEEAWLVESEKRQSKAKSRKYKYHHETKNGNAESKLSGYKNSDRKKGYECTLTKQQLIDLCSNGCYYCGETDWKKLGADRMDNDKGHTIENCVCACTKCNKERGNMPFHIFKFLKHHPDVKAIDIFPAVKTASSTKAA